MKVSRQEATPTVAEPVFSVSQANAYLKHLLDADPLLCDITVTGEVSGYRKPGSGHHYFALRDASSSMRCVMFAPGRGAPYLIDGAQVLARGHVSVYPARGEVQLYVQSVRPAGMGSLQAAFEELKRKLELEGLFEQARKRSLPEFPRRIAVITSPTGAVIQDILNILARRWPLAEVVIVPTLVQGDTAAPGMVTAFSAVNSMPELDVAILARGGGSLEDLWPFNEESVARAIYGCRIPVISAVGHETDFTIADFVADVRAPTPSAAAELVVPNQESVARQVNQLARNLQSALSRRVRDYGNSLELAVDRLTGRTPELDSSRRRIEELLRSARLAATRVVEMRKAGLRTFEASLAALGPLRILQRGYAIVRIAGGQVITRSSETAPGDSLTIMLAEGTVQAETRSTSPVHGPGGERGRTIQNLSDS